MRLLKYSEEILKNFHFSLDNSLSLSYHGYTMIE